MALPPNIILVGFMGAGKTTTGKELAPLLGFEFLDTDQWIEAENGKKVTDIFQERGEAFFREEEKKALRYFCSQKGFVLSTGGGIWLDLENREKLLKTGWCVWLKVLPETAWKRIKPSLSQRPLLSGSPDPLRALRELLEARNDLYSTAHSCFSTDSKTPKEVAAQIMAAVQEEKPFDLSQLQK